MITVLITFLPLATCLFWIVLNALLNQKNKQYYRFQLLLAGLMSASLFQALLAYGKAIDIPSYCLWQWLSTMVVPLALWYFNSITHSGHGKSTKLIWWFSLPLLFILAEAILLIYSSSEIVVQSALLPSSATSELANKTTKPFAPSNYPSIYGLIFTVVLFVQAIVIIVKTVRICMSHSIKAQTIGVSAAVVMYATMAIKLSMTSDTIVWISVLMWLGLSAAIFYMAFTAFIYNNQSLTLQELLRLRVTNHAEYRISKPNTEYAEKLDPLLTDNNEHANNLSAQKQVATEETWLKKRFEHLVVEQQLFLKQGIKIQDIALQLNTNRTYISNYVNSNYGMSFPDYINSLRIEYAKEYMLKEPHTILSEIAKASGFPNASAFNNVFKKTTGITPKIWRATHSSKGIEAKESQMSYSKIK